MRIIKVDPLRPDEKKIMVAANEIKSGGLVAFPTETVYGLGADAFNEKSVRRIFEVKRRPMDNPLIVHIYGIEQLELLAHHDDRVARLSEVFWPGPLTLVLKKKKEVPYAVTANTETVAVRMPSHPVARLLIRLSGTPIAAPSANLATRPSPTRAEHVIRDLGDSVDIILDGGKTIYGIESTVLSLVQERPVLLRPGAIPVEQIQSVVGEVEVPRHVYALQEVEGEVHSPGLKYRHYAPRAKMLVVEGERQKVVEYINKVSSEMIERGEKVGILTTEENKELYNKRAFVIACGSISNPYSIASSLFDSLRKFDDENVSVIYSESFEERGILLAVVNRLRKAAGYTVVRV